MAHKKIRMIILIVIIVSGLTIWFLSKKSNFYYAGTIEATEVTLSSRVSSVIDTFPAQEGHDVVKDQTLVYLKGEDLKLNANISQLEFERGAKLFKSGSLPASNYDKLRYQRDRTALLVEWCTINAPIKGVVLHTYREPGELVGPGMQLLTIGDLSTVWTYIYVEQPMLVNLKLNQQVKGYLPELPDQSFTGKIIVIKDEAEFTPKNVQTREERARLVYGVKIEFENNERWLKPGMTIEVKLPDMK